MPLDVHPQGAMLYAMRRSLFPMAVLVALFVVGAFTMNHHPQPPSPRATTPAAITTTHAPPVTQGAGQGQDTGHDEGYTCTSASSCAVLAAALNGPTAAPQAHAPRHRSTQPRARTSRTPRSSTAQHEDQPGWNCATQGNHVCGDNVAGGPLADGTCPAGGVRVYGTPHGCRYR